MPAQVILWNAKTNAPEEVAPENVREALASGNYTEFTEGRTSVGETSETVSLGANRGAALDRVLLGEQAAVDPYDEARRYSDQARAAEFDNARDKIKTFGEGILNTMSMGAIEGVDDELGFDTRQEELSAYGTAGKLVGIAGSLGAPISPLGALAKGSATVGANVAARIGGLGGKIVGAGVEGALFGVVDEGTHQMFDAVIRDRPFVAERLVDAATIGGLTGMGATAALEGAAKVVAAGRPAASQVSKAVLTDEAKTAINTGVKDAHATLDTAVEAYTQRFDVLAKARKAEAALGESVEAGFIRNLDPVWFETRAAAIKEANAAKKALGRFDPEKLLNLDKHGLKSYTKSWKRYEDAVSTLDGLLGDVPLGARNLASKAGIPRAAAAGDTVVGKLPLSRQRDPFFSKFLDEWAAEGARLRPVDTAVGSLSGASKSITEATEMAGNLPAINGRLGVESLIGKGEYTDALVDAWGAAQFAKAVGQEASGAGSVLRGAKDSAIPWHRRRAAELARFTARKEMGYGYGGFLAGQAAFAVVAGKLGKMLSFAESTADIGASVVEAVLSGGRAAALTKVYGDLRTSYTGRDEDATSSAYEKGEQLRNMVSNEEALRARVRASLEPVARVSPDLATEMEEAQVNRMKNLARKAPNFLALPGAQLPQEKGREFTYFKEYEAVAHDPAVALNALRTHSLTKPMVDSLRENHPYLTAKMVKALYGGLSAKTMRNMSKAAKQQAELLIGYPLFPSMGPSQQAHYAKNRQQSNQTGPAGTPNPRAMPRPSQGAQLTAPNVRPGT